MHGHTKIVWKQRKGAEQGVAPDKPVNAAFKAAADRLGTKCIVIAIGAIEWAKCMAACIFHFGEYSIPQAKAYWRDWGIEIR